MKEETDAQPKRRVYPSLGQSFGLLGILIVITILTSFALMPLSEGKPGIPLEWITFFGYCIPFGLIWFIARREGGNIDYNIQFPGVFLILLAVVFTLSFGTLLDPVVDLIPMPDVIREAFEKMISDHFLSFLTIAVAAPVLEELIFRGVILHGLLQRYSPVKAIFWSSFLFGAAHLNPWQFIPAFLIGLALAWIYMKTRSLFLCIFIHLVNNATSYFLTLKYKDVALSLRDLIQDDAVYFTVYAGAVILFLVSAWLGLKVIQQQRPEDNWRFSEKSEENELPGSS
ncbi:MAG: CPBP family intramembrane metalloprotease [Cyclobacteriaceae bacterium]|nr:CPBP family intramembrane metalloprotease [Cyclobacteriaceae bacterium]